MAVNDAPNTAGRTASGLTGKKKVDESVIDSHGVLAPPTAESITPAWCRTLKSQKVLQMLRAQTIWTTR